MDILIPKWLELSVGAVAFLTVFGFLAAVLLPRVNRVLAERADAIDGGMERSQETAAEASRILGQYLQEIAEARHDAARSRQEAVEQGTVLLAGIRAEGVREREAMTAAARERIAAERLAAETELHGDVVALAAELAGRIVGEPLHGLVATSAAVARFRSGAGDTAEPARD
ncbi:F0F1 ATP synthase subunit B [Streptomyces sp. NBC_00536]|uniref:F0F1 ATP synthase subunit B family protein n=1 Tax=Streptomyces sp. NBC_00536 TaxID=2975769 RepID=UPI002E81E90E|nr:F0F1 ATP synthase subunit B [Streptomyces sp. NBC_00536]WUC79974.1 F0F1 ATP synthase subunit B [Streptomyces sp. NBC_00536]